ncbi:hypothetical protein I307_00193 [Cryptococcus deuterogattii 99/473]|uniref:Chromatin modification-related protein n=1 Tax=Cryptococcus deuterogattii Ram5 TaxID=1296110 RepID=A0A0D0VFX6_9TREE|nr:hypothetical protein I309_00984 [Cryptococcus deuterogattii LA55]KIR37296.1 hypothetical protein I352_00611 [Cryptococcus deuterogattii MMRL2647]KIR43765.1 hypothetical protein I313_00610 [Cryptococcus deuterogattii Ram5]KIR75097.1 hypothetical protein I310_01374 [Cryptococcus deuterogattii CA1014]KIR92766.1 hypothetical protein I304_03346 [Cryptococcus deuterogattii CBS 10090]KIY60393.1 hypothetical protein I307_00193 [Cryptococcus deuterogattii 99/473]
MPPKLTAFQPPSPSPPPPTNDPHDLLVIQDIMDTLDQIPPELTRVHSDLNELGAVLYSTLVSLEKKLYTLIDWIQDPNVTPEKRFELLQEIAEEAARYKLGGDDKIRVAAGACDGILNHQKHISNLLASSTLLNPSPPSPYSQALTLPFPQPVTNSRRVARAANSPFGGRGYAGNGGPSETKVGDTPSKKKRSRVQQLGAREDDETSSAGGEKKKPVKRRKQNRAASPTDSIVSNSGFGGKPIEPRTARQLAAAANRARREADDGGSDTESRTGNDDKRNVPMQPSFSVDSKRADGLGLDMGSREGSGVRSANVTPTLGYATVMPSTAEVKRPSRRGGKRSSTNVPAADEFEEEESEGYGDDDRSKRGERYADVEMAEEAGGAGDDLDSKVYCTCRQVSYGEMIGCDDDDCEIEWYHIGCLGLDKTPAGNWICPRCVERRKKQPRGKKGTRGKARK